MMMASSERITTQALISTAAPGFCASAPGMLNPTERPPPIAADCFRNFLRAGSNLQANVLAMAAPYAFVDFKVFAAAWIAVQVHGAGPALRDAAAELRALHVEHVAQNPQEGHLRLDVDVVLPAVDGEFDHGISFGMADRRVSRKSLKRLRLVYPITRGAVPGS